jgi:hypothetical protein
MSSLGPNAFGRLPQILASGLSPVNLPVPWIAHIAVDTRLMPASQRDFAG